MKGLEVTDFFRSVIKEIRKHTDRPIVVRTHPGDKKAISYSRVLNGPGITLSTNTSLLHDLSNSWATVVYNSSPSVASVIEGIPTFVLDPSYSQSSSVANCNLCDIEKPVMPERLAWIQSLAQCHWNNEDLTSGRAWRHMRNYLRQ